MEAHHGLISWMQLTSLFLTVVLSLIVSFYIEFSIVSQDINDDT